MKYKGPTSKNRKRQKQRAQNLAMTKKHGQRKGDSLKSTKSRGRG